MQIKSPVEEFVLLKKPIKYVQCPPETCVWQALLIAYPTDFSFNWVSSGGSFKGGWPPLKPQGLNPDCSDSKQITVCSLCLSLIGKGM